MTLFVCLKLVLLALTGAAALVWAAAALRKSLAGSRRWDRAEPGIVRQIEAATGQRVEFRQKFNASRTADFTHTSIFWVWLAFTRDCLVLVHPDEIGRAESAHLFVTPRREASIRRLGRRHAELTLAPSAKGEPAAGREPATAGCSARDSEPSTDGNLTRDSAPGTNGTATSSEPSTDGKIGTDSEPATLVLLIRPRDWEPLAKLFKS